MIVEIKSGIEIPETWDRCEIQLGTAQIHPMELMLIAPFLGVIAEPGDQTLNLQRHGGKHDKEFFIRLVHKIFRQDPKAQILFF